MNPFYGRPFQGEIILWDIRWYWHNSKELSSWHIDETYLKVNGQWSYLYRAVDQYGYTIDFYLSLDVIPNQPIVFLVKFLIM